MRKWLRSIWARVRRAEPTPEPTVSASVDARMMAIYASWPKFWAGDLKFTKEYGGKVYYECPWEKGHTAYCVRRPANPLVLFCPCCDRHAWVDVSVGERVKSVLLEEETKFRNTLKRFEDLGPMEPSEAFRLWNEQGCPLELLEELTDYPALATLVDAHREKSRANNRFKAAYS